jgi:hypothetical protein
VALAVGVSIWLASPGAHAQQGDDVIFLPQRSEAWDKATTILTLSSVGLSLVMPRVFYSDPEVTVGWKARFHLSVLAPTMTLAALTLFNEHTLKDSFAASRPGCDKTNQGLEGCEDYGMFSSHALLSFSTLGQGLGIFIVDTAKWSGGRFNVGAFAGHVGVPAILSVITALGRSAGNWESSGQIWGSAGVGLGAGLALGALYATMQRPECGYTGALICW